MSTNQKRIFLILILLSIIYFIIFIFPNNTGAENRMMISLFEPDEFAQYPIVLKMIRPEETIKAHLINFIVYGHYYYGWTFYASSAVALLPIIFTQGYDNVQLNMLILRQVIGVLPMLGTIFLLTYLQTKFKSYKAVFLFIFLLSVSAVVENNLWWHVDSLACFFIALTLFFLDKDDLRFDKDFYLAAASTGLATGTKVIGFFFFLAIPTYLLIGLLNKKISWAFVFKHGTIFVLIMFATIVLVNPFMLLRSQFNDMVEILSRQSLYQNQGWVLSYASGPASWFPIIKELYGQPIFIFFALLALGLGIWKSENRTRHLMIALWAIPFGLYVLFVVAIKPTHFFLPILLPIYSSMVVFFELPTLNAKPRAPFSWLFIGLILAVIGYQLLVNIKKDAALYQEVLTREQHEESLVFYSVLEKDYLPKIQSTEELTVFRDVRMYLPDDSRWVVKSYWNSKYSTIEAIKPDIIILWSQRILDYTQEGAQENAVDPTTFQDTYQFYVDANQDKLRGYKLVYRDAEGLFFVSDELFEKYFE